MENWILERWCCFLSALSWWRPFLSKRVDLQNTSILSWSPLKLTFPVIAVDEISSKIISRVCSIELVSIFLQQFATYITNFFLICGVFLWNLESNVCVHWLSESIAMVDWEGVNVSENCTHNGEKSWGRVWMRVNKYCTSAQIEGFVVHMSCTLSVIIADWEGLYNWSHPLHKAVETPLLVRRKSRLFEIFTAEKSSKFIFSINFPPTIFTLLIF